MYCDEIDFEKMKYCCGVKEVILNQDILETKSSIKINKNPGNFRDLCYACHR